MLNEFKKFALRGNVLDLAVGVILGAAFSGIVSSLVDDIIMPPIGLLLGQVDFSQFFIVLKGDGHFNTIAQAKAAGAVTWNFGLFINAVIKFMIVSIAVFGLVRGINKLFKMHQDEKKKETPPEVLLLQEIRDILKGEEMPISGPPESSNAANIAQGPEVSGPQAIGP
ncbi:large conductance mechanosensitive channel [Faunimonas pinastri]|uniref:Large-conductance mechanosensitive channel n=1 Tax=Faunimonas pinastri TaxID=1855383 RepID=A0A1H9PRJ3_9HYPH|nr:large conductance mechanosensitive channel [Faunimonas pinastri]